MSSYLLFEFVYFCTSSAISKLFGSGQLIVGIILFFEEESTIIKRYSSFYLRQQLSNFYLYFSNNLLIYTYIFLLVAFT